MKTDIHGTKLLVYCGIFAALIACCAFIRIPIPLVPFTLQSMATTLSGLILGPKRGMIPVILYISIGLAGVPVFTAGGGIGYVMQPTFGYLLGFLPGAFVAGLIAQRCNGTFISMTLASICGMLTVYVIGVPYMYMAARIFTSSPISAGAVLASGFLYTLPGDIIKALACGFVAKAMARSLA